MVVLGAGTGFGVAGLARSERGDIAVATEGGHAAFAPSDDAPHASSGSALYAELALSKKGVCRHRAYAFVVTAMALGVPSRLVRNEAHAWVEVSDGLQWHRVDLGGAASHIDYEQHSSEHQHKPPADPYQWPPGAESANALTEQAEVAGPHAGHTRRLSSSALRHTGSSCQHLAQFSMQRPPASHATKISRISNTVILRRAMLPPFPHALLLALHR